jgi:magnesium transporter
MIRVFLYDPTTKTSTSGGEELIQNWRDSDSSIIWLDIENEAERSDRALLEQFSIHPLVIQDALSPRHPLKDERLR